MSVPTPLPRDLRAQSAAQAKLIVADPHVITALVRKQRRSLAVQGNGSVRRNTNWVAMRRSPDPSDTSPVANLALTVRPIVTAHWSNLQMR
jgi:hypothetical protein